MADGKTDTMINPFKSKRPSTVLGLAFDGNRLEAVVLRRTNGHLQVRESVSVPLALSLLSGDPALVGRELRNHLDQAGIRERRCAVCLPLNWVLTVHTKIPDLPEADIESFFADRSRARFSLGLRKFIYHQFALEGGGWLAIRHVDGHTPQSPGQRPGGLEGGATQTAQLFARHHGLGRRR